MPAKKLANICFAKQNLRKMRILKNRGEVLMIFLFSLYWKKMVFQGEKSK